MPAGLSVAIALLAQVASAAPADAAPSAAVAAPPGYGRAGPAPLTPPAPAPGKPAETAAAKCVTPRPSAESREIVVCAERPQGYRLDPDVLEAKRERRQALAGRPHNPHETLKDNSCATVGPMGCRGGAGINLLAAAATLGTMADRLSKGEEIGSLFVTDPQPTEYQFYQEAKKRREAKEAEAAAKAKAKAAAAAKAAVPPGAALPGAAPPQSSP